MIKIIVFTPNNNKSNFYNSWNSIEVPFDDDNHHVLLNSKYFNVNEINALKTKENHFGILHLNIVSLNKHINCLSNLLSLMKLNFPTISLTEQRIGLQLITYPYQVMPPTLMRQKATMVEQAFLSMKSICILREVTLMLFR